MFADLSVRAAAFGPQEREVVKAFNLGPIFEGAFWTVQPNSGRDDAWMSARLGAIHLDDFAESLIILLGRSDDPDHVVLEEIGKKGGSTTVEAKKLTFLIREPTGPSITLKQMSEALIAIESIYSIILRINALGTSEIVVGLLDSGSDKSIDVIGIAEGISKLSEFLLQSWDRVRYSRSLKFSAATKSASDGLTLLEQINTSVEKKVLSAEEGEKLRRTVFKGVDDLFGNGVFTAEMELQRPAVPSQLPLERRKLIAHQIPGQSATIPTAHEDVEFEDSDD